MTLEEAVEIARKAKKEYGRTVMAAEIAQRNYRLACDIRQAAHYEWLKANQTVINLGGSLE